MSLFFKAASAILLAVILSLFLESNGKVFGLILSIATCSLVLLLGMSYLEPVVDFLNELESLGNLNTELTGIILKVVGISIISEIVGLVCTDSGNASLGKALNMIATAVILWLSIPVFNELLELIQNILGEL